MSTFAFVKQLEAIDCGPACISMILRQNYAVHLSIGKLKKLLYTDSNGSSFLGIKKGLEHMGIQSEVYECQPVAETLKEINFPCVTQIQADEDSNINHFIVIYQIKGRRMTIGDPAKNRVTTLSVQQFLKIWIPYVLEITNITDQEKLEQFNTTQQSLRLSEEIKMVKLPLFFSFIFSVLVYFAGLYLAAMYSVYFDLIIPNKFVALLSTMTVAYLLVILFQFIISYINALLRIKMNNKIDRNLVSRLVNSYFDKSFAYLENYKSGELITRFSNVSKIRERILFTVQTLPLDIFTILVTFYILFSTNMYLSFLIFIPVIVFSLMLYLSKDKIENLSYELFDKSEKLNTNLIESADHIETIKNYNIVATAQQHMIQKLDQLIQTSEKFFSFDTLQTQAKNSVMAIFTILVFSLGAYLVINDNIASGILLMFNSLSMNVLNPFLNLATLQATLEQGKVAQLRYNDIIETTDHVSHSTQAITNIHTITLDHIRFSYGLSKPILNGIQLEIQKGDNIAIIGSSGSGKSTLAKLLSQYYEIQQGDMRINGIPIHQFDQTEIKNKILYSPQFVEIFTDTILYNITLGRNIDMNSLEAKAKAIGFDEVVNTFPNGYLTMLGKNGVALSMGQMQLINILRATLLPYDLIIFDEVTNGLDLVLKQKVKEYLLHYNSTKIFITHDMQFASSCDRIYVIREGILSPDISKETELEKAVLYHLNLPRGG